MLAYLIKRLMLLIPTLILLTIILFSLIRFIPGDIVDLMVQQAGTDSVTEQIDVELVRHLLGLDVPIHTQYFRWVGDIITHGNLGKSMWTNRSLNDELKERLPVTFQLGLMALIISNTIAIPLGIFSAIRQDTFMDYIGRSVSILAVGVPGFWLATIILIYPSIWWGWSPAMQYVPFAANPIENLKIMIIPALLIGLSTAGSTMRYTRTMMLDVLRQDYVRTAWAKGLKERIVVIRHALKNALIPLITIIAPEVTMLIGGSVIMEQIFNLPGMGRYLLSVITTRDYIIVSGINLLYGTFTMMLILLTDISYGYLDPRVRYK